MRLRCARASVLLGAGLLLWGCAGRHALRVPDDAYLVVRDDASEGELARAKAEFEADPTGPGAGRAVFVLVRHALHQSRWADTETLTARLEKAAPGGPWAAPLLFLRLHEASQTEGVLRLLQRIDDGLKRYPADQAFAGAARELAASAMTAATQSDLETLLAGSPDGPLAPDCLLALGQLGIQRGAEDEATRNLRSLVTKFPASPAVPRAFELLRELSKKIPVNAHIIGVLVPETGPSASLGASLSQGVRLAAETERETSSSPFEFAFADTAEDPARAVRMLQTLVTERQVIALVGPLFSKTALACAAEANALGVALVTPAALLSRLTQTGPYVFRSALTPEQQAAAIARFAVESRQCRKFGILAPDTAYGRSMGAAFTAALLAAGGTVLVESRYPAAAADFGDAIVDVGGADIVGFKEADEEFRRAGQGELEVFLQKFFAAAGDLAPAPVPPSSATVAGEPAAPAAAPAAANAPPPADRVACFTLTSEPYTAELAQRLRAASLPVKTVTVLAPESGTVYSMFLTSPEAESRGSVSGPEELALSELLGQAAVGRDAAMAVLVAVREESLSPQVQTLECSFAMYDTRTGRRIARHVFHARRPLPSGGNRYGIEALYLPVPGSHLLHLVPQLVYHNLSVTLFGSDTWDDDAMRKRPEAVTLEAYFTTAFWPDLPDSRTADFTRRYQERFAAPPDAIAAASYDAARLLMRASLASDGTREGLRQELASTGSFDSVVGPARLTPQRELEREPVILRIAGGAIVPAR